jgi:hypothetical protein
MSRKTQKSHKKYTQRQMEVKTNKLGARLLGWTLGVCTLLGGLAAAITFLPRVTIIPSDPVDPENPFSVSFTVTNASFIPIPLNDVSVRVFVGEISGESRPFNPPRKFNWDSGGFTRPDWEGHRLQMDERFTITLQGIFGLAKEPPYKPTKLNGGDIAMIARYKPWFIPMERESAFRFTTHRQSNGLLYCYSTPME